MESTKLLDDEPGIESAHDMAAADELSAPTDDEIAELAYAYWESRGGHKGSPWEDWFRAERELKRRNAE
jgi:hypothetical protein